MNYNEMSLEELILKNEELMKQRDALKKEAGKVSRAVDLKLADKSVRKKYEQMSHPEKQKLAQMLKSEGIESGEAIGVPGAKMGG